MINNEKNVLLYIIFLAYPFLPKIGFFGQYIYVQELLFLVLILSIKSFKINNSYRFIYILNILLICYIFFIIICNNFDINLNIIKNQSVIYDFVIFSLNILYFVTKSSKYEAFKINILAFSNCSFCANFICSGENN